MSSVNGLARTARGGTSFASLRAGARTATAPSAARTLVGINAGQHARYFMSISEDGKVIRDHLPPAKGLYDPKLEKDSCGTG